MNQNEIDKIINTAAQAWQDKDRFEMEAYIAGTKAEIARAIRNNLSVLSYLPEPSQSHIREWVAQNGNRFSLQVGAVIEAMLRKELLGD